MENFVLTDAERLELTKHYASLQSEMEVSLDTQYSNRKDLFYLKLFQGWWCKITRRKEIMGFRTTKTNFR